jgi:Tfp pilus assembly protein PilX
MVRRRLMSDERGVVLIVVMAMMLVLGIIAASVLATSIASNHLTRQDRAGKQAYSAALTGLRAAIYRLNAYKPDDDKCPPLIDGTAATIANGACGPYGSDTTTANVTVSTSQPLYRARYQYWVTPVLTTSSTNSGNTPAFSGSTPDLCVGNPPVETGSPFPIEERCITVLGTSLDAGGNLLKKSRIEARVSAGVPFFPIPGVWGTNCLTLNPSGSNWGSTKGCVLNLAGVGSSVYQGSLGSNVMVRASVKDWEDPVTTPSNGSVAPANMYLGNTSPTSGVRGDYQLVTTNTDGGTVGGTTTCAQATTGTVTYNYPCLPWYPGWTGTVNINGVPTAAAGANVPKLFNAFFQLPRMEDLFTGPPRILLGAPSLESCWTAQSTKDTATCNNNSFLSSQSALAAAGGA